VRSICGRLRNQIHIIHFSIVLPPTPRFSKLSLPFRFFFLHQNSMPAASLIPVFSELRFLPPVTASASAQTFPSAHRVQTPRCSLTVGRQLNIRTKPHVGEHIQEECSFLYTADMSHLAVTLPKYESRGFPSN
jgi:hypothetical protein